MDLDPIIWWTGAIVLGGVGAAGAAALIAGMYSASVAFAIFYLWRMFNLTRNIRAVHEWVAAGKPIWQFDDEEREDGVKHVARMKPSAPAKREEAP